MEEVLVKLEDGNVFPGNFSVKSNDMDEAREEIMEAMRAMGLKPVKVKFMTWKGGSVW